MSFLGDIGDFFEDNVIDPLGQTLETIVRGGVQGVQSASTGVQRGVQSESRIQSLQQENIRLRQQAAQTSAVGFEFLTSPAFLAIAGGVTIIFLMSRK